MMISGGFSGRLEYTDICEMILRFLGVNERGEIKDETETETETETESKTETERNSRCICF